MALAQVLDQVLAPFDAFTQILYENKDQYGLESWPAAAVGMLVYVLLVVSGKLVMAKCAQFNLRVPMGLHNLVLFIWSVAMAVGGSLEVLRAVLRSSFSDVYCATHTWSSSMWFWAWLFYASKFYEFVDTFFIILRKRPLIFLHVYHHAVVVPLSLIYMKEGMTFFINGVISNALIHSFMYWSYYQQSRGVSVPWKKHLTKMQMVQFLWGMLTFIPYPGICGFSYYDATGPSFVFWFHQLVLLSFLMLFLQFFQKRYAEDGSSPSVNGLANGVKKVAHKVD